MSTFQHTTRITLLTLSFHRLTLLSHHLSPPLCSPSDHFPVFTELSLNRIPLSPPTSHSFRRLHSIDTESFLSDLKSSQLITNPPDSIDCLLTAYNSTLSSLFDKHAPIITKISNRKSKSNPWFSHPLRAFVMLSLSSNTLILLLTGLNLNLSEIVTIISSLIPKKNNIFPNWSPHHLIIHGVSGKL